MQDGTNNRVKYRTRQELVLERLYKMAKSSCQHVCCLFVKIFEIWMLQLKDVAEGIAPPPFLLKTRKVIERYFKALQPLDMELMCFI